MFFPSYFINYHSCFSHNQMLKAPVCTLLGCRVFIAGRQLSGPALPQPCPSICPLARLPHLPCSQVAGSQVSCPLSVLVGGLGDSRSFTRRPPPAQGPALVHRCSQMCQSCSREPGHGGCCLSPDLETLQGKGVFRLSSCGTLAPHFEGSALLKVCSRWLGVAQGSLLEDGAAYLRQALFLVAEVFPDLAVVHMCKVHWEPWSLSPFKLLQLSFQCTRCRLLQHHESSTLNQE